ncbi:MAG TPA: hypothetical protein VI300_06955, partial [Solirubrobacter sp.]
MNTCRRMLALAVLAVLSLLAPSQPALAEVLFTPVPGTPLPTSSGSNIVRVSPDGSRLFALNPRSGTFLNEGGILTAFDVAPSGQLLPVASIKDDVLACGGYALGPAATRVYASGVISGVIAVGPGGGMARVQTRGSRAWCPGNGVEYVAFTSGDVVYVNESAPGAPNSITAWPVDAGGSLGLPVSFATGDTGVSTSDFQPSPAHRLLYASGRLFAVNAASVSIFDVQLDGALLPAPGSPYAVVGGVAPSLAVSPDAAGFFVATRDAITTFVRSGDGYAPARSVPTPSAAAGMDVDPSGRFLVAAFPNEDLVRAFDATTLVELPGSPLAFQGPTSVAFDGAGTRMFVGSAAATGAFDVLFDRTPPVVTFVGMPPITSSQPLSVTATVTDPDDGIASAELRVDGTLVAAPAVGADGSVVVPVLLVAEGPHTITLSATDEHRNTGSASATVVYDVTGPSLSVADAPPLTTAASYAFSGSASDANGITELMVRAGGVVLHPPLVEGTFAGEIPLAEGVNSVLFTAIDAAGNSTSVEVLIQRDTLSPDLAVTSPVDGSTTGAPSFDVTFTVSDASAVTTTVSAAGVVQAFAGAGTFTATVMAPGEGVVPVLVSSQDAAGNPPTVRGLSVLVDLSAPLLDVQVSGGGPLTDEARFGPLPGDTLFYTLHVDD